MKKSTKASLKGTMFLITAILFMALVDQHMMFCIPLVACMYCAVLFYDKAAQYQAYEQALENDLYERMN
jgi:hypothetical protein